MVLHYLARFFILSLLCVAACCIRFYLFENSTLVGNTKMKRVLLKSNPTECLGECVHLDGCESFNVFYDEFGRLICDLYSISNKTLKSSPLTMHFTVNEFALTQPLAKLTTEAATDSTTLSTISTKTVTPVLEFVNIVRKKSSDWECVSSNLKWILKETSCQLFYFVDGGALALPNGKCAQITGSQIIFSTITDCDNFTFPSSVKQFKHTNSTQKCIRFFGDRQPMLDNCDKGYKYEKKEAITSAQTKIDQN